MTFRVKMWTVFAVAVSLTVAVFKSTAAQSTLPDMRPPADKRSFRSAAIDNLIDGLVPLLASADLARLFSNCLPNTLDTTVYYHTPSDQITDTTSVDALDTFVITGDIAALWLRDSTNQVLPYVPYAPRDSNLQYLLEGLISRQAKSVLIDSFANAFNFNATGEGHQKDVRTPPMTPSVFEGKYELDSLCAFLKLSYWQWQASGDASLVRFATESWLAAAAKAVETIRTMQVDDGSSANPPYLFQRLTSTSTDTLFMSGRGPPANARSGLSRQLFRPSDDAVTLPYNIPGNAMACVELNHLEDMLGKLSALQPTFSSSVKDLLPKVKTTASGICGELKAMISQAGATKQALPFEVDGFGSAYFMDDANVPSLLSLPTLGFLSTEHPAYSATRSSVLSTRNPYYFQASTADQSTGLLLNGIGGPHVGYNMAWPMAITTRAMTSNDDNEIKDCLAMLIASSAGTGLMHESFNVDNAAQYTRDWFAWANGLLGELVLQLVASKPHLVIKDDPEAIKQAQSLVMPTVSLLARQNTVF